MSTLSAVSKDRPNLEPFNTAISNVEGRVNELQIVELDAQDVWRLTGDNRWRAIVCTRGEIWITQERDIEDYVLTAGDIFLVTQPGKVLIGALCAASVEISPSLRKAPYRGDYRLQA